MAVMGGMVVLEPEGMAAPPLALHTVPTQESILVQTFLSWVVGVQVAKAVDQPQMEMLVW
jgi:hypothetical protein